MPRRIQYEFPPFVFDSDILSLTSNGNAVRLSEQSARVLAEFLHHPGVVISRKQISQALWPGGEYTASEQGINNIISKLRISLRDDPRNPRYIETIPKRGYRFLVPVVAVSSEDTAPPDAAASAPGEFQVQDSYEVSTQTLPETTATEPLPEISAGRRRRITHWPWLYVIVIAGLLACFIFWLLHSRHTGSGVDQEVTLAVAPFDVRGSASPQFAESFRVDLIDALAGLPGIRVRAAHSLMAGERATAGQDGRKLGVTAILYTEFSKTGTMYDLQTELVRASDATHLYAWHYSGTIGQLESIREMMLANIFSYWKGTGAAHQQEIGGTRDSVAYELYLRARYEVRQRDDTAVALALQQYRQAIALDPHFARAYAGLAFATYLSSESTASYRGAETLALKAIVLAPNLAEAHAVLGNIYFRHDWRFADGVRQMQIATALAPNDASYHMWLAFMFGNLGRFQEGFDQIAMARKDDPYWAPVYENEANLGLISHNYDRMRQATDILAAVKPGSADAYHIAAWAQWETGHYREAVADWRKLDVLEGAQDRVSLEDRGLAALNTGGPKAYARLRLALAMHYEKLGITSNDFVVSEWAAFAGDNSLCLSELKKMIESRDVDVIQMAVNPAYDSLHHDPRFLALVRQVGLPLPRDATPAAAKTS